MTDFNALILAAGHGRRLHPLSDLLPKPLVPLFTIPLVDFALARLTQLTPLPRHVIVNLHHRSADLVAYLGHGQRFGLDILYSEERPHILGTGGALRRKAAQLAQGPVIVQNADVFFSAPLDRLRAALARCPDCSAAVGLTRCASRPELNLVKMDTPDREAGGIVATIGPPASDDKWVFAGVHLLTPRIFDYLPPDGFSCVVRDGYRPMIAAGHKVAGVALPDSLWHDLGTPLSYLEAHLQLFPSLATFIPPGVPWPFIETSRGMFLHPEARVAPGAELTPPVVIDAGACVARGARVGPRVVLGRDSVVDGRGTIRDSVVWPGGEALCAPDEPLARAVVTKELTLLL